MSLTKEDELRVDVVEGAKAIFSKGLVETGEGNVSIRNGKKEEFFITPSFNQYSTLKKEEIVHLDFEGNPLSAGKLPSTEAKMHIAIYKSRPKVQSVIHTHSTFASMFSTIRKNIPIIMEEMYIFLGGTIDISAFGEAHTEEIGQVALNALGMKNAALLASHGVIVCGKSIDHAIKFAELVEKLAKIYWGALQIGEPEIISNEHLGRFEKLYQSLFANYPRSMREKKNNI
ncbi:MAG: class II aldolase/adducin family protein [Candidatus Lokiarchaeota archaeon]|nr:class II aldolase/adducin family protein [Candidatus Lokiarchaeota archaeon]